MISNDDILKQARFIAFPVLDNNTGEFRYSTDQEHNWVQLPKEPLVYRGYDRNSHHYTVEYHKKYVIPELNKLLKFGFDINDFNVHKNILHKNNMDFDLSYLDPIKNKKFEVTSLEYNLNYNCDFSGLRKNEHTKNTTWFTEYHDLYCLPHSSSIVKNLSESNGKSILILGDSQLIPSLSILCYYYKKLTYVDNRNKVHLINRLDDYYDDILIQIYSMGLGYYINFLR